ncbi:MAG: Eco57I restriction-modification methylase domain-containing protein, partial [Gemmatimonadales bacterium]
MDLAAALAAVQTLADLPVVIAALGHEPLWEEIPVDRWLGGARWRHGVTRAAVVGRAGQWLWYAIETDSPEVIAPRLGRWLGRRNRPGGLVAFNAARRFIALSVAAEPAPIFSLPLDCPGRLALSTLHRAAAVPRPGPFEQSIHVADALAHRRIDTAFFEAFRAGRDRLAAAMPTLLPADRETLALLHLTRILFLYFIQAKGWLDGREDFLARALDDCLRRGRHPERDLLHPLFFGTLNRPTGDRTRGARAFGRVPFLNGGLFEPHPLERHRRGELPAILWRDLFDQLFERFHFSVAEGNGDDVAPDMLGRVFEGLMAPSARKASGTFYTPPAIVARLLNAGLAALIESRLGVPAARAATLLANPDARTRDLLRSITVLDPAAGSGAFLLGALERLSGWSSLANPTEARRSVLRHNLFGVDLSATAVRLAELRLWLAVVRDDPAGPGDQVDPLPNLDCVVRQGDSLRDPLPALRTVPLEARDLAAARAVAIDASGNDKRAATAALRRAEHRTGAALLGAAERHLDAQITECLLDARAPTLFTAQRGLDAELTGRLRELRRDRARVRDAVRRLRRDGALPWFHYPSHFGDVFARGGFDLVVGNPPWVRAENIPVKRRAELAERFRWWRGSGGRGFSHRPDLALAFLERSIELTRPGGVVSLLLPAKLGTAGYAARARHVLATSCTVHTIADLQAEPEARFDASVYPLALVVTKCPPRQGHGSRLTLGDRHGTGPTAILPPSGPWILAAPGAREIAESLARQHPSLIDRGPIHLGVKTGSNAAFLDP